MVNTEDFAMGSTGMSERSTDQTIITHKGRSDRSGEKIIRRVEKLIERLENNLQSRMEKKSLGNINDPVDKWFWFWGISWGLGIMISIFTAGAVVGTGIGLLWWLLFAIGSVSLVIWLVKKFG